MSSMWTTWPGMRMYTRTCARLEGVFFVLEPSHFFIPSMLDHLLESVPMLVPFQDNENSLGLCHVVQPVATYLIIILYDPLQSKKDLGGFHNSLSAFQLELVVEELFFGQAMCSSSRQYSSSLSVSVTHPDSLTTMRGFLRLAPRLKYR